MQHQRYKSPAAADNHRPREPAGALISIVRSQWPGPGSYLDQLSKIQPALPAPDSIVGSQAQLSLSIHL